jgi:hypothetical protein
MYYISTGFNHPRMSEDLGSKINDLHPVGHSSTDTWLFINLLNDLTDIESNSNLEHLYEDFLKSRALDINSNNVYINRLKNIFETFKLYYTKKDKNAIKFYLLKVENNQVKDVLKVWKSYRENV